MVGMVEPSVSSGSRATARRTGLSLVLEPKSLLDKLRLCWREDSLAAVGQAEHRPVVQRRRGGVFSWAETRVVVRRCGGLPPTYIQQSLCREREGETHESCEIATRVFDPEAFSSSRGIVITTG